MPTVRTFAEIVVDAESLLSAIGANGELLQDVEEHRVPLEQVLGEVKGLSAQQKTLTADKQKVTQDLKAAVRRVRDLTMQLRAVIRGKVGIRNEKLVEFRVAPLRKRTRKAKRPELAA